MFISHKAVITADFGTEWKICRGLFAQPQKGQFAHGVGFYKGVAILCFGQKGSFIVDIIIIPAQPSSKSMHLLPKLIFWTGLTL